nr:hypothetical protein [Tanacetum cinerariifolium]
ARGAGSCGREWGEVVGISWSGGGVVMMGEKGIAGLAGVGVVYSRFESWGREERVLFDTFTQLVPVVNKDFLC